MKKDRRLINGGQEGRRIAQSRGGGGEGETNEGAGENKKFPARGYVESVDTGWNWK